MKKFLALIFTIFTIFLTAACSSSPKGEVPPIIEEMSARLFVVNLYNEALDIRLGEEESSVFTARVQPMGTSLYLKSEREGEFALFYKQTNLNQWSVWRDQENESFLCPLELRKSHCVYISPEGRINYFIMDIKAGNGAYAAFLNASSRSISELKIGMLWEKEFAIHVTDLKKEAISGFSSIIPGNYGLFWQQKEQKSAGEYSFHPGPDNNLELFPFNTGFYYLFILLETDGELKPLLFNIPEE